MRLIPTTPPLGALALLLLLLAVLPGRADDYVEGPHLTFNVTSGQVYSQHNAFDRWYPASLTKMMTAYTVFREIERGRISMKSPVRISENARREPPSKMGFPAGTILTVESALRIILVKSANDVATAIAESVGGDVAGFSRLMNRYAAEIGMENSHFVNSHGLHDVAHYSSAHDLGMLSRRILRDFPQYRDMFAISAIKIGKRVLNNHNALIGKFPGTIGLKTGFICAGGVSIATAAKAGEDIIVSIVMGEQSGRIRNLRTAEYLKRAMSSGDRVTLHIDEMRPSHSIRPPIDIRPQVCGKKKPQRETEFLFADPAIEYFAVKQPVNPLSLEEREAAVYSADAAKADVIAVSLGGASGPDPFELLVEKPLPSLAEENSELDTRFRTEGGKLVAIPTPRPSS